MTIHRKFISLGVKIQKNRNPIMIFYYDKFNLIITIMNCQEYH